MPLIYKGISFFDFVGKDDTAARKSCGAFEEPQSEQMENVKSEGEFYYKFSSEGLCLLMCKLEEILTSTTN